MFGAVYAVDGSATDVLVEVAREFSPRIEIDGPCAFDAAGGRTFDTAHTSDTPPARQIILDLSGVTRLFGDAHAMGEALCRTAAGRGLRVRVVIAGTRTAARLLVCAASRPVTVVDPGTEAAALARLPIQRLAVFAHDEPVAPVRRRTVAPLDAPSHHRPLAPSHVAVLSTFRRWGLCTLGEVAALPAAAVAARLGQEGVRWQRLARGEDPRPLLPVVPEERFEQALDLEWPIEGLEPLSFVLDRLLEPLEAHLERRGRGAAVLHVRLHLVTRTVHARSLQLPAPMRDARTLRALALLDLESHPPDAAIDRVVVAVDPTPARVLQFSLLTRPLPSPDQISTLMARLDALMGEGRSGSPAVVDTWQPGAFAMKAFAPREGVSPQPVGAGDAVTTPAVALRRFRVPVPARVRLDQHTPVRVTTDRVAMRPDHPVPATRSASTNRGGLSGGDVQRCAGPWRTSGGWWTVATKAWDRDEWDVTLTDGATYRVFRDRSTDAWFIEGVVD
jgi:protein ImuB